MSDDFQVGDVVVRVRDLTGEMPLGSIRRVKDMWWWDGDDEPGLALLFEGEADDSGWYAENFRKLPRADESFTETMRALKPHRDRVPA